MKTDVMTIRELSSMNYPAPSEELWIQNLLTSGQEILGLGRGGGVQEECLENYIVGGLIDFGDSAYALIPHDVIAESTITPQDTLRVKTQKSFFPIFLGKEK